MKAEKQIMHIATLIGKGEKVTVGRGHWAKVGGKDFYKNHVLAAKALVKITKQERKAKLLEELNGSEIRP